MNRVGDFSFLLGIFLVAALGSLNYRRSTPRPDAGQTVRRPRSRLLLFGGAAGKSAQLPLYVWLPDAMEGPTPVSALIHAATMVTAGVYMCASLSPCCPRRPGAQRHRRGSARSPRSGRAIAAAQYDIKRVLAYSTVSQLGYMFLALGCRRVLAAIFHLVTHAFFKALLFLGAGSVMHATHGGRTCERWAASAR